LPIIQPTFVVDVAISKEGCMKILYLALLVSVTGIAAPVRADVSSAEAERLNSAATVLHELRASPDQGISEDLFKKAECVAVIPGVKKAALGVGGEYGKGVVSCRTGQTWSAPAFMEMEKGSVGLQIGGQQTDLVLLVMNKSGLDKLLGDKVTLGADMSVAAGPVGRNAAASTDATMTAQILAYSRSKGAFAGIDLSGGSLRPDTKANEEAYGAGMKAREIVNGQKAKAPQAAAAFMRALASPSAGTSSKQ
jgi:lipid-binding SYLF domain-containing protein